MLRQRLFSVLLWAIFSLVVNTGFAAPVISQRIGTVRVLSLTGTHHEMGMQYGRALKHELKHALAIIKEFYVIQHGIPYQRVTQQASQLYERFPMEYQSFIHGVAHGSGMSLDDVKVLNGMETLMGLEQTQTPRCAYLYIPAKQTLSGATLIGRNYDYPAPFDKLSQFLTVTVMHAPNQVPTAFISLAGQIYCPTCVNANGVYMELNNGMPSGGYEVNKNSTSLLTSMLLISETSANLAEAQRLLGSSPADFSLIVNVADYASMASYEYSTILGTKALIPNRDDVFVSTNFYLHPDWVGIPAPTDASTWLGVTRRNNLLNLAKQAGPLDAYSLQALLDKKINEGGAVWAVTIYQLIYDASDQSLYVKVNQHQKDWVRVELNNYFQPANVKSA